MNQYINSLVKKNTKHVSSEDEATVKVAADLNDISVIFILIKTYIRADL